MFWFNFLTFAALGLSVFYWPVYAGDETKGRADLRSTAFHCPVDSCRMPQISYSGRSLSAVYDQLQRKRNLLVCGDVGMDEEQAGLGWLAMDLDTGKLLTARADFYPLLSTTVWT